MKIEMLRLDSLKDSHQPMAISYQAPVACHVTISYEEFIELTRRMGKHDIGEGHYLVVVGMLESFSTDPQLGTSVTIKL